MRLPRPTDTQTTALKGGMNPAQINIGVAKEIGAAGAAKAGAIRQLGDAFASVAGAFGEVSDRQAATEDSQNASLAKLDFIKMDNNTWTDINNKADEQGNGYETTGPRYQQGISKLNEKYPISDPKRRQALNTWMLNRATQRGFQAAKLKQGRLKNHFGGIENREITGASVALEKDPSFKRLIELDENLSELIGSGEGRYATKAEVQQKTRAMRGQLLSTTIKALSRKDPGGVKTLFEQIAKTGRFAGADATKLDSSGPVKIYGKGVPSSTERRQIFKQGGVVVNLDTNWAKAGSSNPKGRTGPLIVIPDNASPAQRAGAQAYVEKLSKVYKDKFGVDIKGRVLTTSQNGRGRAATMHTEPFALTDKEATGYFSSPEGRAELASITKGTLGKIPGAVFSLPHNEGKGDRGAHGSGTNEVKYAKGLLEDMQKDGQDSKVATGGDSGVPAPKQVTQEEREVESEKAVEKTFDGRMLAPGQKFTVKINGEDVTVTSKMWNNLRAKDVRSLYRFSSERNTQIKRERAAEADDQMRNNISHVEQTGEVHKEYDRDFVRQNTSPKAFKRYEAKLEAAQRGHAITQDMPNMSHEVLERRLLHAKPQENDANYAIKKEAYDKAFKSVERMYNARDKDPALAVDGAAGRETWGRHSLVQKSLDAMGGAPKNKNDWHSLIDARIKAQRAVGIDKPVPLTNREARHLARQVRNLPPEGVQEGFDKLFDQVSKTYGTTYADEILDQAIESSTRNEEKILAYKAMIDDLEEPELKQGPRRAEKADEAREQQIEGGSSPWWGRQYMDTFTREGAVKFYNETLLGRMRTSPSSGSGGPKPSARHIEALKANPERAAEFEQKFGLPAGAAKKYLK